MGKQIIWHNDFYLQHEKPLTFFLKTKEQSIISGLCLFINKAFINDAILTNSIGFSEL